MKCEEIIDFLNSMIENGSSSLQQIDEYILFLQNLSSKISSCNKDQINAIISMIDSLKEKIVEERKSIMKKLENKSEYCKALNSYKKY